MNRSVPRVTGATPPPTIRPEPKVATEVATITECTALLESSVGDLNARITQLEERLSCVLGDPFGTDPEEDVQERARAVATRCILADRINTLRAWVECARDRVGQLINRVEV